jgi:hypothetical protein
MGYENAARKCGAGQDERLTEHESLVALREAFFQMKLCPVKIIP